MDLRPPPTVIQFAATMKSRNKDDLLREFVLAYYVEDKAIIIGENTVPNSGFRGGNFLQKSVVKNPSTGKPYEPSDIYVGAELNINGFIFILQEASEDALKIMEAHSDVFTKCDLSTIMFDLQAFFKGKATKLLVDFQHLDKTRHGHVNVLELQQIFNQYKVVLGDQEFLTLFRRFQIDGTTKFNYQDFVQSLV